MAFKLRMTSVLVSVHPKVEVGVIRAEVRKMKKKKPHLITFKSCHPWTFVL